MSKNEIVNGITIEAIISAAIKIPGVRVNREAFLREMFKNVDEDTLTTIISKGPIEADCSRETLKKIANKILTNRTSKSTFASFVAGIPGGFAMAATIPADIVQFYGMALGMAQEIAYLYGEEDLWENGELSSQKVTGQLILYCGVMLGIGGASQTVRVLSSSLAKQALKKLPQKALTKTFYYPMVKSIAKVFGAHMTKEVFAKGVSKVVPILSGVVSGTLTLASMAPMGKRLIKTFEEAHFSYTEETFNADWKDILEECENIGDDIEIIDVDCVVIDSDEEPQEEQQVNSGALEKITQAKEMMDNGVISEEEFETIKAKFIAQL